jgi:hypothetical protein
MKSKEELLKTFTIVDETDLIAITVLEAQQDEDDNGLQAELLTDELIKLIQKDPTRRLNYLIDLTRVGSHTTERARSAYIRLAKVEKDLRKVGIVGEGFMLKAIVNTIMGVIGKSESVKWFKSLEEARSWIAEDY